LGNLAKFCMYFSSVPCMQCTPPTSFSLSPQYLGGSRNSEAPHYVIFSKLLYHFNVKKCKAIPVTGCRGPYGCETSSSHIFQTVGSLMAVRLSALRAGRSLPPRKIPGTHFC
jgi:hypothetical protein